MSRGLLATKRYARILLLSALLLPLGRSEALMPVATFWKRHAGCTAGSQTFTFTGGTQTFGVPAGCTSVFVQAWGGGGAAGQSNGATGGSGGGGGYAATVSAVTSGESLTIYVAGGGSVTAGGYGYGTGGSGGGPYSNCSSNGGGGGGGSAVRRVSTNTYLVQAPGGGGGTSGYNSNNGCPGTLSGSGLAGGQVTAGGNTGSLNGANAIGGGGGAGGGGGLEGGAGAWTSGSAKGGTCSGDLCTAGSGATPGNSGDAALTGGRAAGATTPGSGGGNGVIVISYPAPGLIANGGGRKWFDGTYAKSCNDYRNPTGGTYAYTGLTGDGVYTIDVDGAGPTAPFNVYCDMTTNGGGWTLAYKASQTTSVPATQFAHYFVADAQSQLLDETAPATSDYKYLLANLPPFTDILFKSTGGTTASYAVGTLANNDAFRTAWKTFYSAGSDRDLSGSPSQTSAVCPTMGGVGVFRNDSTYIYNMAKTSWCFQNADSSYSSVMIGDGGCGVSQCYRTYHLFYPTDTAGSYSTIFDTGTGNNNNVRIFFK